MDGDENKSANKWPPKKRTVIVIIAVVVMVAVICIILYSYGIFGTSAESFSLWGTPDWVIRNKGHKNQVRSDSHVSEWSIDDFKKSVDDFNAVK